MRLAFPVSQPHTVITDRGRNRCRTIVRKFSTNGNAGNCSAGIAAGRSPLEQAQATELGRFGEWSDTERLAGNLHVAYREADANPAFSVDDAIGEMMIYNGGQLPRCLA